MLDARPVPCTHVTNIVILEFHLRFRIHREDLRRIGLIHVTHPHLSGPLPSRFILLISLSHSHGDETVGLQSNRQHRIIIVVQMSSDDIDPPRRPRNELRLTPIALLVFLDESKVARPIGG
jgi:hypothetical protein